MKTEKNEAGFSLIEIFIILVSIGILFAIVASTYTGIQARSRNNQRTAEIRVLQEHIESFYSQNMYYPSRAEINNAAWRKANLKGVNQSMLQDPSWNKTIKTCTLNGEPILISKSQPGCLGYQPTNNGASCEANATTCNDYTLTATLEQGGGVYSKSQLD